MMLPPSCKVNKVSPENPFSPGSSGGWVATDVTYSLVLSQQSHVIIMYQYTGHDERYFVTRLRVNSTPLKHTVAHSADNAFIGNFGMWQGPLSAGTHKLALEHRSPKPSGHHPASTDWQTRTMTIINC